VTARIALVGDHDPTVTAHRAIPKAIELAAQALGVECEYVWVDTDAIGAEVVGLRILDLARHQNIPRLGEPLRCSIGTSTLDAPDTRTTLTAPLASRILDLVSQQLIGNADAALYQAKSRGGACMGDNTPTQWPAHANVESDTLQS